ncbi:hypothetical protein PT974_05843 [Cladobotryum mycophilum]|uniref:Protein kinase domain-containing protein n=1 Tax=Cladobotryum mycophilum TaxID=491253 RepID=A0ABR0SJW9_9HYPO
MHNLRFKRDLRLSTQSNIILMRVFLSTHQKETRILKSFARGSSNTVCKVLINGQEMLCKATGGILDPGAGVGKEIVNLGNMQKLLKQNPGALARTEGGNGHASQLIWGDGKPANIIIDERGDDAWLIDFGGGYTNGWVDRDLENTVEGDKQAVENIRKCLDVGRC